VAEESRDLEGIGDERDHLGGAAAGFARSKVEGKGAAQ
jgi:hypothetical protein